MAKWFYQTNRQQSGPVDPAELKRLATTGDLKPTDKVRREDLAEWYEARKVKGLFPASESQVAPLPVEGKSTESEAKPGAVWWPMPDDISKETLDPNIGGRPVAQTWTETPIAKWYYLDSGQEVGPVEISDLKRLVDEGRLKQHDKVRRADGTNWNTIEQLADLFAACQAEPTKRRANPKPNSAALYGCGCLLVPLILSALITVIVVTTSPSVDPGVRERLDALNREARRVLTTFDATPPPIEDAVTAGKKVWLLENCPLMLESLQDSLYVVVDGNRVDKIIVKSRVSKIIAKVTYKLEGESIIWNETELKKTADPNSDFAFGWTIDVRRTASTLVVIAKSFGIPIKAKDVAATVTDIYKVTAILDPGKTSGKWTREHTLDVKNVPQYSAADKHETDTQQGEVQLLTRQSK